MTLVNLTQESRLVAMAQAEMQMSLALDQAREEHASALQNLGKSVQSSFAALLTQNEHLQKEVIGLKAQSVTKDAAHEAQQKAMRELFETLQKRMKEMSDRVKDLERAAQEHSHGSNGTVNIGPKPIQFPLEKDGKVN